MRCRPFLPDLETAVRQLKPSVLIGVAAQAGAFTPTILSLMAQHHQHPVVFSLSNPTSLAECTAQQAFVATQGRVVFASGSPNPPLVLPGGRQVGVVTRFSARWPVAAACSCTACAVNEIYKCINSFCRVSGRACVFVPELPHSGPSGCVCKWQPEPATGATRRPSGGYYWQGLCVCGRACAFICTEQLCVHQSMQQLKPMQVFV
jgi:hypothetical protein